MYIDFWSDEYDNVDTDKLDELTEQYKKQVDRSVFRKLEERFDEYGLPVYESFPEGESMESFIMLEDDHRVTVRVGSEGGLVNIYINAEIPREVTKDEAIVRAVYQVAKEELGVSRIEASYYRNKEKVSIQTLWKT